MISVSEINYYNNERLELAERVKVATRNGNSRVCLVCLRYFFRYVKKMSFLNMCSFFLKNTVNG